MDAMSRLPGKSNITDKIPIKALRNKMKRRAAVTKFVIIIVYDKDEVQIFLQYGKVMNNI